ncbi:Ig-like domain-containing protein [Neobacillus notoginsengisoli]|uniref:Ig-like domain-containing protein n=1 Tax=Neobacillus notoginsengisoli TaxID=1578198 RepID=UPI001F00F8DD|nr:Ig-like domain-containing protein [Neobacillus notoginsengisoli]
MFLLPAGVSANGGAAPPEKQGISSVHEAQSAQGALAYQSNQAAKAELTKKKVPIEVLVKSVKRNGEINANATRVDKKGASLTQGINFDYTDPKSYPLVEKGDLVDYLYDPTGHAFYYENLTDYNAKDWLLKLWYQSEYKYAKDRYFWIEYYKEIDGKLFYDSMSGFDTYGYDAVYLNATFEKADFLDQPYIYMIAGVTPTQAAYYSDYTLFKIKNPFYKGSGGGGEPDSFALISNESADGSTSQPTGTFSINNKQYTFSKKLKQEAYRLDVNIPFDPAKVKGSLVDKNTKGFSASYNVGDTKSFWVMNLVWNTPYQINARLAYSGTKGDIWVHNSQISDAQAAQLGREFDAKIYSTINTNFGKESDVDGNGKINILCFDILDGFNGSGGYVGGYFYGLDLYNQNYSNKSEIFYIDTYPTMGGTTKDVSPAYGILAHEFQHMVNFNQNVLVEGKAPMDVWLNEALSLASEQVYSGKGVQERIDYYNYTTSIPNGHSLVYWDNQGDVLANYALSYLFSQYIRVQAGKGNGIYKELINDPNNNYLAVENLAKKYISSAMTFGKLMTHFRGALLQKEATGLNGFKGDPFFNSVKERPYTGSSPTSLRGGGAIAVPYLSSDGFKEPSSKGQNITYTYFTKKNADVTPPAKPVVKSVTDKETKLTGSAEANAAVFAKVNSKEIGKTTASSSGTFSIAIPAQPAGTKISVYAQDAAGNVSEAAVVTVKLAMPISVKAAPNTYNSVKLTWTAGSAASGYEIYRSTSAAGTYSKVGTVSGTSFVNSSLNTGTTYYYKIRAYKTGTSTVYSDYSPVVSAKPVLSVPVSAKAASASYNSIKTSWAAVSGSSGYEVYRSTASTGTYSLVGSTTSTSFTNSALTPGATYYYKVRAYRMVGTAKVYSGYSAVVSAKPIPSVPASAKAASASYNSIKTSWAAVSGASGYQVYRATTSSGTYTLVGTTTATSFTNSGLTTGKAYYYKVRAYRTVGTSKIYSGYSSVVSAKPVPAVPANFTAARASSTSIKVSYSAVTGATGYEIHRATTTNGTYTLAADTKSLTFTNTKLTKGKTYYYKTRAYRLVGKTKIYSGWTVVKSAKP